MPSDLVRTPEGKDFAPLSDQHTYHAARSGDVLHTSYIRHAVSDRRPTILHPTLTPMQTTSKHTPRHSPKARLQLQPCIVRSAASIISLHRSVGRGRSMNAEPQTKMPGARSHCDDAAQPHDLVGRQAVFVDVLCPFAAARRILPLGSPGLSTSCDGCGWMRWKSKTCL